MSQALQHNDLVSCVYVKYRLQQIGYSIDGRRRLLSQTRYYNIYTPPRTIGYRLSDCLNDIRIRADIFSSVELFFGACCVCVCVCAAACPAHTSVAALAVVVVVVVVVGAVAVSAPARLRASSISSCCCNDEISSCIENRNLRISPLHALQYHPNSSNISNAVSCLLVGTPQHAKW